MDWRERENHMWAEACEMLERAERLQRQFFRPALHARLAQWEPPVDIYEAGDTIWIIAALPGVSSRQLDIMVEADSLTIRGARSVPFENRDGSFQRMEIPHGRFERRIFLTGTFELAHRELVDGCLHIALRKVQQDG